MTPVRIGVAGYGYGGRFFHAPLIASAAECELLGVITTSPQRRAAVAADFPGLATFRSLGLGLAVVCDKPFALDAGSARRTVLLAEELGRPLTAYQNRRWDSDFRTVRKALAGGLLGDPVRFESRFERFAPGSAPPPSGGGTLRDFGSHLVDQALVLFGPARTVYAEIHAHEDAAALDDDFFAAVTHAGGVHSHLWGSWRQGAPGPRLRVTGTAASYVVAGEDGQEDLLVAGHSPATHAGWSTEPEDRWGRIVRGDRSEALASERGAWDVFFPAFAAAVRGDGPVPVDPWDAVATARLIDAAMKSAATGAVVTLDSGEG